MLRVIISLLALAIACETRAQTQPSFDCTRATNLAETLICLDKDLIDLDAQLAVHYRTMLSRVSLAERSHLIKEQRKWIATRNALCGLAGRRDAPTGDMRIARRCLASAIAARTMALSGLAQSQGKQPEMAFREEPPKYSAQSQQLAERPSSSQVLTGAACADLNGLSFVRIPGGEFVMGANVIAEKEVGYKDERPRHPVRVASFCIMRDAVTQTQAEKLRTQFKTPSKAGEEDAALMTWLEAKTIAQSLSRAIGKTVRLPTEAEWEFAARGGLANKEFPWGSLDEVYEGKNVRDLVLHARQNCKVYSLKSMINDDALRACVQKVSESDFTIAREFGCLSRTLNTRVGSSRPNPYGLFNLVNNEWEWTSSRYMPYPYRSDDGRESNLLGKRETRVVRGGNNNTESCKGYTSLRGYGFITEGQYESRYRVRFVVEE